MGTWITQREGDVVVERGEWVYVVRRVRGREAILTENWWDGSLLGLVGVVLLEAIETVVGATSKNWKVAVLRHRETGFRRRVRVVHKERLPEGEDPAGRVQELVDAVNRGEFEKSRR